MCIQAADRTLPTKTEGKGFKVFIKDFTGGLLGEYSTGPRAVGKWLKAEDYGPGIGASKIDYEAGFHVFVSYEDAVDYTARCDNGSVVCSVEYRRAYLRGFYGWDRRLPTIIAREIKILPA